MKEVTLLTILKGHVSTIWSIIWGISGNYLISSGVDSSLIIWGPCENFKLENTYTRSFGEISYFKSWCKIYHLKISKNLRTFRSLAKKINSNYFSISDFLGNSYLLEIVFLKYSNCCLIEIKHILRGHLSEIKGSDFSYNEHFFSSCGRDRSILLWKKNLDCDSFFKKSKSDVKCVKWNPSYMEIAFSNYDGNLLFILFQKKKKKIFEIKISNSVIWNIFYEKFGKELIIGNGIGEIFFLDLNSESFLDIKKKTKLNRIHYGNLKNLVFLNYDSIQYTSQSERNYLFLNGSSNGTVILTKNQITIKSKKFTKNGIYLKKNNFFFRILSLIVNSHYGKINSIIWHPFFENVFVSCGDDSNLNIWRVGK